MVATQIVLKFYPYFGEDEPILTNMFQMGWFNPLNLEDSSNSDCELPVPRLLLKHLAPETLLARDKQGRSAAHEAAEQGQEGSCYEFFVVHAVTNGAVQKEGDEFLI